jgi:lysophospholipase L1-like esterase
MRYIFAACTAVCVATVLLLGAAPAHAQQAASLDDINGDGVVSGIAFGDSITFGIGDGFKPGEFIETIPEGQSPGGYPRRLRTLLGIPVSNTGVPGEELVASGIFRVPQVASANAVDFFLLMEGSNDAVKQVSQGEYARALQRSINVARAQGRSVVPLTPPPPTGIHAALAPFTNSYSLTVRDLAAVNGLRFVDLERTWSTVCPVPDECPLYNLPEGLHPNSTGYDAIAQSVAAVLLGIDLFSPTGPSDLESALALPAGSVVVRAP